MKKGSPTLIIVFAIVILTILSLLPLSKWSGGRIKDFSLISDILKEIVEAGEQDGQETAQEQVDPELLQAMEEAKQRDPLTASDSVLALPIDTIIHAPKAPREGDLVVIEDYTTDQVGLIQFKNALSQGQMARIAVVGDSYIEGDIFTQDLRENLQTT